MAHMNETPTMNEIIYDPHRDTPSSRPCLFSLVFNNRKRQGWRKHVQHAECEGTLYTSGHVHLDTVELACTDFMTLQQMRDYVEQYGDITILWKD